MEEIDPLGKWFQYDSNTYFLVWKALSVMFYNPRIINADHKLRSQFIITVMVVLEWNV